MLVSYCVPSQDVLASNKIVFFDLRKTVLNELYKHLCGGCVCNWACTLLATGFGCQQELLVIRQYLSCDYLVILLSELNTSLNLKQCMFCCMQIVFFDLRKPVLDELYKHHVESARIGPVLVQLDIALGNVCAAALDTLHPYLARALLQATTIAMQRVLLDGGPYRWGHACVGNRPLHVLRQCIALLTNYTLYVARLSAARDYHRHAAGTARWQSIQVGPVPWCCLTMACN